MGLSKTLSVSFVRLQESLLRVAAPIPEVTNFNRMNYSSPFYTPPVTSTSFSNVAFTWASEPDGIEFTHNLNRYGFRDRTWRVKHEQNHQRIIFIGDSFVEGFMADDEETIPRGFAQEASTRKRILETLNLGIAGSRFPEYYTLIRDAVPLFQPEYLLLVFYANNFPQVSEFEPAWLSPPFIPQYAQIFKSRFYQIAENMKGYETILHALKMPAFSFIEAVPDSKNPWSSEKKAAYFRTFVAPKIATAMKRGRFNPHIVNYYIRCKKVLRKSFNIVSHLNALKHFVTEHSCKLFIAYIPFNNQVSDAYLRFQSEYSSDKNPTSLMKNEYQIHARILKNTCQQLHIPFQDLTPILRKHEARGERLYWNYDPHMKGKGYLLVGKYLYNWFESQRQKETL
jgi:hypothetical protein